MAYPKAIEDIEGKTKLTLSAAVGRGDIIGYSSGWKLSDADAATNIFAQYVALQSGKSGEEIIVCRRCTFYDEDAPYTIDTSYYTSGTAGDITTTRPATNGDLIQVIGRAVSTRRVRIEIEPPQEWEMFLTPDTYDTTGEPGIGTTDAGWVGPQIDAATEATYFKGKLPSGLVGSISEARAIFNSIGASAFDCDVDVVATYDGGTNTAIALSFNGGDWNADTDNILSYMDVSACFAATVYKPKINFCLWLDPDAITGDANVIGVYLRGWKV